MRGFVQDIEGMGEVPATQVDARADNEHFDGKTTE